jgi:hypothetical protein
MRLDDETLMAFADDALPPEAAQAVAEAVAADPALAERVERFRAVRRIVAEAAAAEAPAPPPGLMEAARRKAALRPPPAWLPPAIAAGFFGLAVGVGSGFITPPLFENSNFVARGALNIALDRTPSGQTARGVQPLYTVAAADGRPCRVFRLERATPLEGVACHEQGVWRLLAIGPAATKGSGFGQAASGEPTAVASVVDALRPGNPLSAEDERRRIEAGWE